MTTVVGAKLPRHLENLDSLLYELASPTADLSQSVGITPNGVTFLSFVSNGASLWPMLIGVLLSVSAAHHLCCQEAYVHRKNEDTYRKNETLVPIAILKGFFWQCQPKGVDARLRYTRWLGTGTANMYMCVMWGATPTWCPRRVLKPCLVCCLERPSIWIGP